MHRYCRIKSSFYSAYSDITHSSKAFWAIFGFDDVGIYNFIAPTPLQRVDFLLFISNAFGSFGISILAFIDALAAISRGFSLFLILTLRLISLPLCAHLRFVLALFRPPSFAQIYLLSMYNIDCFRHLYYFQLYSGEYSSAPISHYTGFLLPHIFGFITR